MSKSVVFLFFLCLRLPLFAQQEAMYTHYMHNTLAVNPAYAGSREALSFALLHRSQWIGFDGAPTTQTFTMHSPVRSDAVNLGFSVLNDKVGPINTTGIYLDYAYRFQITDDSKLALGLKLGFNAYSSNLMNLKLREADQSFAKIENIFSPNIGFGAYYSAERFYLGLSTPKLLQNNYLYSQNQSGELAKEARHYYFIVGGLLHLAQDIDFKPTSFVKMVTGAPVEADFTGNFIFYEQFELGAMYRTGDALGLLVGYRFTPELNMGYSFDWSFVNNTAKYNDGSHELLLSYDFIYKDRRRIRSPRYF